MSVLTLDRARTAAITAEVHAHSFDEPYAVTVVDAGGHALLIHRQDGVPAATGRYRPVNAALRLRDVDRDSGQ